MSTEDDDGNMVLGFDHVDWDDGDVLDSDEEGFQDVREPAILRVCRASQAGLLQVQEPAQSAEKVADALMERQLYRIGQLWPVLAVRVS